MKPQTGRVQGQHERLFAGRCRERSGCDARGRAPGAARHSLKRRVTVTARGA
jgi:hypothetical protein